MRIFILICCLLAAVNINAAEADLPAAAVRALEAYQRALDSAEAERAAAEERAFAALTNVMEREVNRLTRRGDLDAALAVRAALEARQTTDMLGQPIIPAAPATTAGAPVSVTEITLANTTEQNVQHAMRAGSPFVMSKDGYGRQMLAILTEAGVTEMELRRRLATGEVVYPDIAGRGSYIGLVTREYGAARERGDYVENAVITIGSVSYALPRWDACTILWLPIQGGAINGLRLNCGNAVWGPEIERVIFVP